jgi:hypothetical protein
MRLPFGLPLKEAPLLPLIIACFLFPKPVGRSIFGWLR